MAVESGLLAPGSGAGERGDGGGGRDWVQGEGEQAEAKAKAEAETDEWFRSSNRSSSSSPGWEMRQRPQR